ncbi:stalk domain-containing protein [Brevibacillus migulae]|uniref:stalk domain-containing protein n=1 Tax=Brevibacillus migulae TaxID=1644114 RepID=UPI00196BB0F3|nr:stalk domain-containing protein [Brevibacillus migulae]
MLTKRLSLLTLGLCLTATTFLHSSVATAAGITVTYNNQPIVFPDQKPVIQNSRTLVPIRPIAEKLGFTVGWNAKSQTVTISKAGNQVELTIAQKTAKRNQQPITLDVPAKILNQRTVVPLRFIAEALSYEVNWLASAQKITITDQNKIYGSIENITIMQNELDKQWRTFALLLLGNQSTSYAEKYSERTNADLILARYVQAAAGKDVKLDDAGLTNYVNAAKEYAIQKHYGTPSKLKEAMAAANVTDADIREFAKVDLLPLEYIKQQTKEDELKDFYEQHQELFTIASVRHILVNTEAEANQIIERLDDGESFASLAKELSLDPGSKGNGGLYADLPVTQWIEEFKQATLTQEIGKVGKPVKTDYGYHVILVEKREVASFADVKEDVEEMVWAQKKTVLRDEVMKKLKKN